MEGQRKGLLLSAYVSFFLLANFVGGVACDVPDDVVYTDLHRHVQIGDSVGLKCQFRGIPLAVHWMKGDDPQRAPTLFSWTTGDPVTGVCGFEKLCQIMEMNEEHSLVIKEVSIAEQGRYICRVKSYKGEVIHNFTEISLFSPPNKPYPFINECLMSPEMKSNQTCILSTTNDAINISCTVSGYFPDLDLFFLCGSHSITIIHSEETTNGDGKKNKSITIQASPRPESYMCVASHILGVADQSAASVLLKPTIALVDRADSKLALKIVVPLIVVVFLVMVMLSAFILWRNRQQVLQNCTVESTAGNCDDDDDDTTPMDPDLGEVHLDVNTFEEAGKTVDGHHRPVLRLMDESKSKLTDGALEELTLIVPTQPSPREGNNLVLPENGIAARNKDELSVTNSRMLDQMISDNEIRHRLRHTAERFNRHDKADVPMPRDLGPDFLIPKNDKQFMQQSVSDGSFPNHYGPCGGQTCKTSGRITSELIQIMVRNLNGRTLIEKCRSTDTVKRLYVKISEKLNIAPSQLRLSFQGKNLSHMSTCSLKCHRLNNFSTVVVNGRLVGGSLF